MKNFSKTNWEPSDFTSEDLIFSSAGGWRRKFSREFESDQSETAQSDIHAVCFSMATWHVDDSTPKEPSLADQCTLVIRQGFSNLSKASESLYSVNLKEDIGGSIKENLKNSLLEKIDEPLYSEIFNIYKECAEENWDGCDAKPITIKSCLTAISLTKSFPKDLQQPDIIPEPTGEIAFEWYRGKEHVFVLSVSSEHKLSYAGLFGKSGKSFGSESFSDSIPSAIISKIRRVFA